MNLETNRIILKNHNVRKIIKNQLISNSYFIAKEYLSFNKRKSILFLIKSIIIDIQNKQNKHRLLLILKMLNIFKS